MIIKTLFRGLTLLTLVLVFKANSYGNPLGLNNSGTSFNTDGSGVFITPGLGATLSESNAGISSVPTDKHDYVLGSDGFFTFDASILTHVQDGPSGRNALGGVAGGGPPSGSNWPAGGGERPGTLGPGSFAGFGVGGATGDVAGSSLGTVVVPTPEPSSLLLLASGLAGVAHLVRKRDVRRRQLKALATLPERKTLA